MDTSELIASSQNLGQAKLRHNHVDKAFLTGLNWDQMPPSKDFKKILAHVSTFDDNSISPLCLTARASASNNPTFTQAMNGPDADGLRDAMNSEMGTLDGVESWIIVRCTDDMNGDQQTDGVDVFDTYAPVVSFST
eukprot:13836118-Ditylum_brightwellii.AAC.2